MKKIRRPLLSIGIPTYNRVKYLKELISNIEKQIRELKNPDLVEIVISDNFSGDGTGNMFREYKKQYKNVRYFKNNKNIGFAKNLNNIVRLSNGEYIWFLGDDDLLAEDALKNVIKIINYNKGIPLFVGKSYRIKQSGSLLTQGSYYRGINKDCTYTNMHYFLKKHSYCLGFMSINIVRSTLAREYISVYRLNKNINTAWQHAVLLILILYKNPQIYIISQPIIKQRIGNLVYGPDQILNVFFKKRFELVSQLLNLGVGKYLCEAVLHNYFVATGLKSLWLLRKMPGSYVDNYKHFKRYIKLIKYIPFAKYRLYFSTLGLTLFLPSLVLNCLGRIYCKIHHIDYTKTMNGIKPGFKRPEQTRRANVHERTWTDK